MQKVQDWLAFKDADWKRLRVDEEYEEMLMDAYIEEQMLRKYESWR